MTEILEAAGAGVTRDAFLGGRFTLLQPKKGLRAGGDAMLLAAAVPAVEGETVVEAGLGTGAAALALLSRVGGTRLLGIESHAEHAALARANAGLNAMEGRLAVVEGDILAIGREELAVPGLAPPFDHAMANPPYYRTGEARPGGTASRAAAHVMAGDGPGPWVERLAGLVRPGGTVTVIHRPEALPELLAAMAAGLGGVHVLPLAPREGRPASRVLVQGTRDSRAPLALLAPFVLHGPGGGHTSHCEAILRGGAGLDLAGLAAARQESP